MHIQTPASLIPHNNLIRGICEGAASDLRQAADILDRMGVEYHADDELAAPDIIGLQITLAIGLIGVARHRLIHHGIPVTEAPTDQLTLFGDG